MAPPGISTLPVAPLSVTTLSADPPSVTTLRVAQCSSTASETTHAAPNRFSRTWIYMYMFTNSSHASERIFSIILELLALVIYWLIMLTV